MKISVLRAVSSSLGTDKSRWGTVLENKVGGEAIRSVIHWLLRSFLSISALAFYLAKRCIFSLTNQAVFLWFLLSIGPIMHSNSRYRFLFFSSNNRWKICYVKPKPKRLLGLWLKKCKQLCESRNRWRFWSIVSKRGTHFADSFLMPKSSCKISITDRIDMPATSDYSCTITFESSNTTSWIFFMISGIVTSFNIPDRFGPGWVGGGGGGGGGGGVVHRVVTSLVIVYFLFLRILFYLTIF